MGGGVERDEATVIDITYRLLYSARYTVQKGVLANLLF